MYIVHCTLRVYTVRAITGNIIRLLFKTNRLTVEKERERELSFNSSPPPLLHQRWSHTSYLVNGYSQNTFRRASCKSIWLPLPRGTSCSCFFCFPLFLNLLMMYSDFCLLYLLGLFCLSPVCSTLCSPICSSICSAVCSLFALLFSQSCLLLYLL